VALTYLTGHSERVYVKDLCQAAGVSEHTLDYAFRAERSTSPMAYRTRIRLHLRIRGLTGLFGPDALSPSV